MVAVNHHSEQERRAAESHGLRPTGARTCPRVVAGKRCLIASRGTCVCHTHYHVLDHRRIWLDRDGRYVLTGEPYDASREELAAFTEAMGDLGLQVTVKSAAESFWNPGSTLLILVTNEQPRERKAQPPSVSGDWAIIVDTIAKRWNGEPRSRNGSQRTFGIPSPTGGHLSLEITLRRRWCSLSVDRWATTDRVEEPSQAWFEQHVWPMVHKAVMSRAGGGFLPSGGGAYACAHPIERADLLDLMIAWVDAELTWGQPKNALAGEAS